MKSYGERRHTGAGIATSQSGGALLGAVVTLVVMMSLAAVMAVNTTSETRLRGAFGHAVTGFYAAESGLNMGMAQVKNAFLDYNVPAAADFAPRSVEIGDRSVTYALAERTGNPRTVVVPAGEPFAGVNSQQYGYVVSSEARNRLGDREATVAAEFLVSYIPLFQFIAFYTNDLEVLPGPNMRLTGRIHTNGNLYLGTGAALRVEDDPAAGMHTVQVSAGGNIYRGRKDRNLCEGQVFIDKLEDVLAPFGDLDPRELPCSGGATRLAPQSELDAWHGSIKSRIESINIPLPDIVAKGDGVFWRDADLRIVLVLDKPGQLPGGVELPHAIEAQNADGSANPILTDHLHAFMTDYVWNAANSTYPGTMPLFYTDLPLDGPGCGCTDATPTCAYQSGACYAGGLPHAATPNAFSRGGGVYAAAMGSGGRFDLDYRRGGFYNWRERRWMLLFNINVGDLIRWNQENGDPLFATDDTTHGGLVIYASVEGSQSDGENHYGVRLFGGANLAIPGGIDVVSNPTGLTMVSDQAVYVLGDYNRGLVAPASLHAWSDPAILPRQPAAVIGDTVNVLSENYWNPNCAGATCRDGQSPLALGNIARLAANTVINAAFLAGVDSTPDGYAGNYNGGFENYPRFHESWNNISLRYRGSFVSLGEPFHVSGAWCGTGATCNIYNPPLRDWNFDVGFNEVANLPPLTPRFTYLRQRVFAQEFR